MKKVLNKDEYREVLQAQVKIINKTIRKNQNCKKIFENQRNKQLQKEFEKKNDSKFSKQTFFLKSK